MDTERLILDTDNKGNLKGLPKYPPNKKEEVVVGLWWVNEDIDPIGHGRNILIRHADIFSRFDRGDIFNWKFSYSV